MTSTPQKTAPHRGKLAVLMPGLGAVATTFMAGAMLVRRGKSSPVGSLTQLGQIETSGEHKGAPVRELVDLADQVRKRIDVLIEERSLML